MGQRLLIHVNESGEEKCVVYYHWSAYTFASLLEAAHLVEGIPTDDTIPPHVWISNLLAKSGGGLDDEDRELFPELPVFTDRNEGIVSVSENARDHATSWEEGSVILDLTNQVVSTDCFWALSPEVWVAEEYGDESELKELPVVPGLLSKLEKIPFSDLPEVIDWWKKHCEDFPMVDADTGKVIETITG